MKFVRILAFSAALVFSASPVMANESFIGKISKLEGKVTLLRGGEKNMLKLGSPVAAQDIIQTQQNGIAEVQFDDLSVVTIGTDSQLTIDAFVYNPQAPAADTAALSVGSGFFHFVSGKLAREKVSIQTPVSTIGIRGTELAGEVSASGKTMVSLVECCVDLKNSSGVTSLERVGTYSEVKSIRSAPSKPDLTPDWWAERAVAALGKSRDDLGLPMLDPMPELPDSTKPVSSSSAAKSEGKRNELGAKNRTSFPFIE